MTLDFGLFNRQVMQEAHRLALVLKGHLWLEACVNRALEVSFHDSTRLALERESFARKVNLAVALHAIPRDADRFLLAVNRLRNAIAHQLDREVTSEDVAQLKASIEGHLRVMYDEVPKSSSPDLSLLDEFKNMLLFMVMAIEHATMMREYEKTYQTEISTYQLLLELRKLTNGTGNDDVIEANRPPAPPDPRAVWSQWRSPTADDEQPIADVAVGGPPLPPQSPPPEGA